MGSTTSHGFPYPVGTDRVMDGDNAMQALAQYTDDYLLAGKVPRCRIAYASTQSIPNNVATDLNMSGATVVYDTAAMADTANSRILIKQTGLYVITLTLGWVNPGTPTGFRMGFIIKNPTGSNTYLANDYRAYGSGSNVNLVTDPLPLVAGDSIGGRAMHTQGVALALNNTNGVPCSLTAALWMGQ